MTGSSPDTQILRRDPATPLWVGTVVLRLVTFGFAIAAVLVHQHGYQRPLLGWVVLGVMACWTAFTVPAYLRERRRPWIVYTDVLLTCALLMTSPLILAPGQYIDVPLITTVWASVAPVAMAVLRGWPYGMAAGFLVAVCTALARGVVNVDVTRDAVLLVGAGLIIGMASTQARATAAQLRRAMRTEAALAERERLARSIHDSVLQVLARVRRRGSELGGEAAELARLAGEQEIALRTLVSSGPQESTANGEADLGGRLQMLGTSRVQVSVPAQSVLLPEEIVSELLSVVGEALSNVDKHAGPMASAWVLLEELPDAVVISVRDDGPGIPDGRITSAAEEGRMGIAKSMRGRITELGGTINLETAPDAGTEWEIRLPRAAGRDGAEGA
ncbi:MAG: ATP-binding protein [Pseudonocardiaceae bacterium]|nr:ATP-binding protein [Pseudonocardiaceae bacterium]